MLKTWEIKLFIKDGDKSYSYTYVCDAANQPMALHAILNLHIVKGLSGNIYQINCFEKLKGGK